MCKEASSTLDFADNRIPLPARPACPRLARATAGGWPPEPLSALRSMAAGLAAAALLPLVLAPAAAAQPPAGAWARAGQAAGPGGRRGPALGGPGAARPRQAQPRRPVARAAVLQQLGCRGRAAPGRPAPRCTAVAGPGGARAVARHPGSPPAVRKAGDKGGRQLAVPAPSAVIPLVWLTLAITYPMPLCNLPPFSQPLLPPRSPWPPPHHNVCPLQAGGASWGHQSQLACVGEC